LSRLDDCWLLGVVDLTAAAAGGLKGVDDVQGFVVGNLTKDNVLAIEPASDNSGDKELRAIGVRTSIGHGQKSWLGVLFLEVLISELLTVDRLATGAIATGEVTTLEHKLRNDTVKGRTSVSETFLASAESTEVLSGLWHNVIVKVEVYAAGLL